MMECEFLFFSFLFFRMHFCGAALIMQTICMYCLSISLYVLSFFVFRLFEMV